MAVVRSLVFCALIALFSLCSASDLSQGYTIDACETSSQAECKSPSCVWCVSAAVGAGCYTPAQAKRLPPAIFRCKTSNSLESACDYKTQAQCVAASCKWCRSAAVPASCYTPEDADKLPASVFRCSSEEAASAKFARMEDNTKAAA